VLDAIKLIFDWSELLSLGLDCVVYAALALVGTGLFLLRLGMALLFDFGDADFDLDADIDGGASFSVFSLLSVTAFFMGTGWMGLAARLDMGLGTAMGGVVGVGFGVMLMLGTAAAMYAVKQMAEEKSYDTNTAVGRTGTVYMSVPGENAGAGKVRVSISGRSMIVPARTAGPKLEAFTDIQVVSAREDGVLFVEKAT